MAAGSQRAALRARPSAVRPPQEVLVRLSVVVPLAVALALAAACSADPASDRVAQPAPSQSANPPAGPTRPTTTTIPKDPPAPTGSPTDTESPPPPPPPPTADGPHLRPVPVPPICGLLAAPQGVQEAVDAGHLPWRLDPAQVVRECLDGALGQAAWVVRRLDTATFAVSEARSGLAARLRVEQPARLGAGGVWVVAAAASSRELNTPPACVEPDVAALRRAFAAGHQPWRGSPVLVAEACLRAAFGWTHPHGRLVSAGVVSVVDSSLGRSAEVYLRQSAGPGPRIWLVTAVEPEVGQD
jgi:hypothetical protein